MQVMRFAGDRRISEEVIKARISSIDLRYHTNEALRESLLDLSNTMRFQRVTTKLMNQWKLMRTRANMERKYGASLDDPEMQRRIQFTADALKRRRKEARNNKKVKK